MKVACPQEHLQRALTKVSRAIATKTTLPVLSNVLLVAEEGGLRISATNLEIGITSLISTSVSVELAGKITVDARLLTEFVNTLPNAQLKLSSDPARSSLLVECGRDNAAINGIDADDFPVIPTIGDDAILSEVDPRVLREMIGLVEFAAASDESRPVLAGVLARFEGTALTLAAADGFRLAVREGSILSSVPERLDVIVPARAMRELARLIGDEDKDVRLASGLNQGQSHPESGHVEEPPIVRLSITPNQSQLLARIGNTDFLSRLIDGTFPDFRQIIPRDFATTLEMPRDGLVNAVRRASYFARDNNDVVRLSVQAADGELTPRSVEISATAAERGNSQSFVDAAVTGPETQIAFNARYLSDVLNVLRQSHVMIGVNGANQAGVIRGTGNDDYTHVIMPMVIGAN
ncbi:MAG: DNA polymerase III subunit beta [Chloroflexota bacterium]|nr:DNA polymerase III subunit beta [Chloroflexota bacterium]